MEIVIPNSEFTLIPGSNARAKVVAGDWGYELELGWFEYLRCCISGDHMSEYAKITEYKLH